MEPEFVVSDEGFFIFIFSLHWFLVCGLIKEVIFLKE